MKLSVVSTLYQSVAHIEEFLARINAAASLVVGEDFEVILVNDGSPDESMEKALHMATLDRRLVVIDLSRNFGHHKAMMTGLRYAKGQRVFLIDIDLEEKPEWLIAFSEQMAHEACDVVYGVQVVRRGGWFERWSGVWFYRMFNALTGIELPINMVTARLMSRRYVDALLLFREREIFIAGLWHMAGFDQRPQQVIKVSTSRTTYSFQKKMAILIDAVTSFSKAPLVFIFYVGTLISGLAALSFCILIINWLFFQQPVSGWTSVMASIWLLGGMVISFIGVVGIYLSKIFSETKQRPSTIVRAIYGKVDGHTSR